MERKSSVSDFNLATQLEGFRSTLTPLEGIAAIVFRELNARFDLPSETLKRL